MTDRIEAFKDQMQATLAKLDQRLSELKKDVEQKSDQAREKVQAQLEHLREHQARTTARLEADRSELVVWAREKQAATKEAIEDWKARQELARLQERAEKAERHAAAALAVALAAIDVAEEAALESWLARLDAGTLQPA